MVFALNDLSKVKPPAAALAPGEQFIGPVFDDSAVRFFLVFDPKLKLFHYILDETIKPADVLVPAPVGDGRILIGKRTGFAFYRDQQRDRKIMIGAYDGNVIANNYLDGPFDQMPDNFMKDDAFRTGDPCRRARSQRPDQPLRQLLRRRAHRDRDLHGVPRARRTWKSSTAAPPAGALPPDCTKPASRCRWKASTARRRGRSPCCADTL